MNWLIPIICGILYRLGGLGKVKFLFLFNPKLWRQLGIGLFLAYFYGDKMRSVVPLSCILTYFIATNFFYYGEGKDSWINLRELLGKRLQWALSGFMFGLASYPLLGDKAFLQAIIGAISTYILLYMSNEGIHMGYDIKHGIRPMIEKRRFLNHGWVEFGIGCLGTIMFR